MKVLLTGFEPFGGETVNPAYEAVSSVRENLYGCSITKLKLPTVFNESIDQLEEKIKSLEPDVVLSVGQAGGRFEISIERVAINIDEARIPDNRGNQPMGTPIYEEGANAYFATIPIRAILRELQESHIPATVSNTAGTYVCNHVMYGALYLSQKKYPNIRAGFIHVPFLPIQVVGKKNTPSMALADIISGLEYSIKAIAENPTDIAYSTGETH